MGRLAFGREPLMNELIFTIPPLNLSVAEGIFYSIFFKARSK